MMRDGHGTVGVKRCRQHIFTNVLDDKFKDGISSSEML